MNPGVHCLVSCSLQLSTCTSNRLFTSLSNLKLIAHSYVISETTQEFSPTSATPACLNFTTTFPIMGAPKPQETSVIIKHLLTPLEVSAHPSFVLPGKAAATFHLILSALQITQHHASRSICPRNNNSVSRKLG